MTWTKMILIFLLLRKNVKQLNEFIESHDKRIKSQRRSYIIGLKCELASLPRQKYNLLKSIATEIDRFSIKEITKEIITHNNDYNAKMHSILYCIEGTNIVVDTEELSNNYFVPSSYIKNEEKISLRGEKSNIIPWILYDNVHDIHFIIKDECTIVNDVVLFENDEHMWFIDIFKTVKIMKIAEDEIIKQQQLLEQQLAEERKKEDIFSKYS